MCHNTSIYKYLLLTLTAGLLLRLGLLTLPLQDILARWGSDDLFYYTQIAGYLAQGHGFTFDGINPTNGFQPLFLFLLAPFGKWLLNDPATSVYLMLDLVTVLTLLAAWQLYYLVQEAGLSATTGFFASGILVLHPKILSVTFNGTEGALSLLTIVLALRAFFWMKDQKHGRWAALIFSALVLTRMDFSVLLFGLFVFAMLQKQGFVRWVKVLVLPALAFAGWLYLNYHYFGNIMPASGQAKSIAAAYFPVSFSRMLLSVWRTALLAENALSYAGLLLCALGIWRLTRERHPAGRYLAGLFVLATLLSVPAVYTMHFYRDWYLMPHYIQVTVLLAAGLQFLYTRVGRYGWLVWLFPLVCWLEANAAPRTLNGQLILQGVETFKPLLPPGTRVGAFNAGLVSCGLGTSARTINLDGVVNNNVLPYLKNRSLEDYLRAADIGYLLDFDDSIEGQLRMFGAAEVPRETVAVFPLSPQRNLVLVRLEAPN
ncbi:MAG: hypothetical protein EP344_09075 [Bacteroidetes bacterium]|nr:MAG: hypothetical protein EP344_09075 [Bacteroidota bacterium]